MLLKRLQVGPLASNCYILADDKNKETAVIDPGGDADKIINFIKNEQLNVSYIFLTHGHWDHIAALQEVKKFTNAKTAIHEKDAQMLSSPTKNLSIYMGNGFTQPSPEIKLKGGEMYNIGDLILEIIHTPGHTPGGISIKVDDKLFTGDALFAGSIGRTDFPGGDYDTLVNSIKSKLFTLDENTIILPGHGEASTLRTEKKENPYLK